MFEEKGSRWEEEEGVGEAWYSHYDNIAVAPLCARKGLAAVPLPAPEEGGGVCGGSSCLQAGEGGQEQSKGSTEVEGDACSGLQSVSL